MRSLLPSIALALILVLTGCADEFATDSATAGASSSGCTVLLLGPSTVDAYDTSTFSVELSGTGCSESVTWSVVGSATVLQSDDFSITVQAGADGTYVVKASAGAVEQKSVTITPLPLIYDVDASWAFGGTRLDWSDTFPGCDQAPADYRYSVRRLVVSGPPLPPEFVNFDAGGCSTVDQGLFLSPAPGERRIRYLVRTFRKGERVATGQTPVLEMDLGLDD